ncbi:hypothetical protein AAVH_01938, partial [Aphelenchoides avenae]
MEASARGAWSIKDRCRTHTASSGGRLITSVDRRAAITAGPKPGVAQLWGERSPRSDGQAEDRGVASRIANTSAHKQVNR